MENNVHTQEFVVEAEQAGERLDRYLTLIYANQSRSFFQKLIKVGMSVSTEKQLQKPDMS